jgi:hypothetical protein
MASDGRKTEKAAPSEAQAGHDERTPFVALGGTALVIAVLFGLALCLVVVAYLIGG